MKKKTEKSIVTNCKIYRTISILKTFNCVVKPWSDIPWEYSVQFHQTRMSFVAWNLQSSCRRSTIWISREWSVHQRENSDFPREQRSSLSVNKLVTTFSDPRFEIPRNCWVKWQSAIVRIFKAIKLLSCIFLLPLFWFFKYLLLNGKKKKLKKVHKVNMQKERKK